MGPNISRRKLLFGGGAVLVGSVIKGDSELRAQSAPLSGEDREVQSLTYTDSAFQGAVEDAFPGLYADSAFQKIKPLAILVTLQRGPSVRALSIAWSSTTQTGTFEAPLFSYVSPGSASSNHSLSTLRSARQPILKVGQLRLIAPFFNWTPGYYRLVVSDWRSSLQPSEPGAFLLSQLANGAQISVTVDAVVFDDWKLMGPDKHNLTRRLQSRVNAEHDEGAALYGLIKSGASDDRVISALQEHISAPRSSKQFDPERWYRQDRRFQAQFLLRCFQEADRTSFAAALTRLKRQPKLRVTRLSA